MGGRQAPALPLCRPTAAASCWGLTGTGRLAQAAQALPVAIARRSPIHCRTLLCRCHALHPPCPPSSGFRLAPLTQAAARCSRTQPSNCCLPTAYLAPSLALLPQLKRCEPLREADVKLLCEKAVELLVEEANVQRVDAPVTICECGRVVCNLR